MLAVVLVAGAGCTARRSDAEARGAGPPPPGPCYDAAMAPDALSADLGPEVACTAAHQAELYGAGPVDSPVRPGTADTEGIFAGCAEKASQFLGASWLNGWVQIRAIVPTPDDWAAGKREYRCAAFEVDQLGPERVVRRTSSLRGALATRGPLAMACLARTAPAAPLAPAACDQPHEAEFVGGFAADPPGSTSQEQVDLTGDRRCAAAVSSYSRSITNPKILVGFAGWGPGYWWVGQTSLRCLAVAPAGKRFTASVKAIGDNEPPTV
jgi:hypothetical protein